MSIFVSHTHADKPLVEPIAERLADVFGRENVFYDSWSIQPGDGIIDKMNQGLADCRYFFFFVSKNSLPSKMVQLEWQNALLKATKEETKIIPVKLDDCMMPAVLLQTLYIDHFGHGPESALRQMVDVASGSATYQAAAPAGGFHNVRAYVTRDGDKVMVEFRAHAYMEPHSRFLILLRNRRDEVKWTAPGEGMIYNSFREDAETTGGQKVNALMMGRQSPTTPGFPFVVELTPTSEKNIEVVGAMRIVSKDMFQGIPVIGI